MYTLIKNSFASSKLPAYLSLAKEHIYRSQGYNQLKLKSERCIY